MKCVCIGYLNVMMTPPCNTTSLTTEVLMIYRCVFNYCEALEWHECEKMSVRIVEMVALRTSCRVQRLGRVSTTEISERCGVSRILYQRVEESVL